MPVNHASFRVDDNPFGYGDQDGAAAGSHEHENQGGEGAFGYEDNTPSRHTRSRRASVSGSVYTSTNHNSKRNDHHRRRGDEAGDYGDDGTSRHSRYRRRASLSCSVESSSDSKGADRPPRRSRRSSLSNVSEATPPLFTGDDILSSTTIDQGNGNRVCVVVVQLDNNGNPMDNNVLQQRGSDRQNSDRKSERSRRRSGSGDFEPHESAGKESRRAADPSRRSSEAKGGDRPRRRLSCNMGDTRESSARPRRGGPSQGKSMREKDDHRGESDRSPRRSSVTHTNSNSSSEDKGRPTEPSLRRRSSIGRATSNVSGSRSSSEKADDSVTSGSGEGESSRHKRKSSRRPSSKTLSLEDKASQSSDSKSKDRDSSGAKTKSRSATKKEGKQKSRDSS